MGDDGMVVLNSRIPKADKERLLHHATRMHDGNTSILVRHAISALVKVLDQQEALQHERT